MIRTVLCLAIACTPSDRACPTPTRVAPVKIDPPPRPPYATACIADMAVATTIVFAPEGSSCLGRGPDVLELVLWQTATRLTGERSWSLEHARILSIRGAPPGSATGKLAYSNATNEVSIDAVIDGEHVRAKVPIASYLAGD